MSPKGWPCRPRLGLSRCSEPPLPFPSSCRCLKGPPLAPAQNATVLSFDLSRNSVVKREDTWTPSAKSHPTIASTIKTPEHPLSFHLPQNPGLLPVAG